MYRVVSDGVRDLRWKPWGWPGTHRNAYSAVRGAIAVGPSGEVWSFTAPDQLGEGCPSTPDGGSAPCTTFYRLGAPETHVMEEGIVEIHAGMDAVDVAQDGTIWEADAAAHELRSFDGEAWTTRRQMPEGGYGSDKSSWDGTARSGACGEALLDERGSGGSPKGSGRLLWCRQQSLATTRGSWPVPEARRTSSTVQRSVVWKTSTAGLSSRGPRRQTSIPRPTQAPPPAQAAAWSGGSSGPIRHRMMSCASTAHR